MHLEATVRLLQRRPRNPVERWDDGAYWRVLPTPRGLSLVSVCNRGSVEQPDLRAQVVSGPADEATVTAAMRRLLGLDAEPDGFGRVAASSAPARQLARALRGMRPPRFLSLFDTFLNVIPFQQVSVDAGLSLVERLVQRIGPRVTWGGRTWWAFPRAEDVARLAPQTLREIGLSAAKTRSLLFAANEVAEGRLTEESLEALPTPQAAERLVEMPGIGPWSAQAILLRGLGRMDAFPQKDTGAIRAMNGLFPDIVTPAAAASLTQRLGPRRGYLYFLSLGERLWSAGLLRPDTPAR